MPLGSMATTPRKILMLHGYSQNANIFSKRLGAIRKSCGKDLDLVFVDGPHVLQPVDIVGLSSLELGAAEASTTDPALTPRAWWKSNEAKTLSFGLQQSLAVLRDVLKADRYEGVFGFSQGAAMAALLAALLEKPHAYPDFLVDGQPPHPPFKLCVAVSGFRCADPIGDAVFLPSYSTPTLHVMGRTDIIVIDERSKKLIEVSANKRVEEHDGGHFVPSKANWRNFLRDYLHDPLGNVPSPGASSVSAPASGTATPTGLSSSTPIDGTRLRL